MSYEQRMWDSMLNIFKKPVPVEAPDLREVVDRLQHLVNTVVRIGDRATYDVGNWSMQDFQAFMDAAERMGGNNDVQVKRLY